MTEEIPPNNSLTSGLWRGLRKHTSARVGLERSGVSVTTSETLSFRMDHARARDAVYSALQTDELFNALESMGFHAVRLHSKATSRETYLQRPDLGRSLDSDSVVKLTAFEKGCDVVLCLADGLSAEAINAHALPVVQLLRQHLDSQGIAIGPVAIIEQGRVAIADEVGEQLGARLSVILIGERPGLTSPTSMGAYITYQPRKGTTDEARNCISNIRPEGLIYEAAAPKLSYFIQQCLQRKLSGVGLKDEVNLLP